MKKFGTVLLVLACVFSLCGCRSLLLSDSEGEEVFSKTITSLFLALDSGDRDAVISLFSPAAQEQDENLEEDIEKLFSVYAGPVDEIGWRGIKGTSSSYEDGDRAKSVFAHFPVRCGETYYWCWMDVMYENTADGDQIGITQLNFYTADEWYLSKSVADDVGLAVFSDNILDEDIRCIRGAPYIYAESPPLDLDEIKDFFADSNSFSEFVTQFGDPNVEDVWCYYELPSEYGKARYLEINLDGEGQIEWAYIVDHFDYGEKVYDIR